MQKFMCCSLRTGLLTVGFIGIVLSCLNLLGDFHIFAKADRVEMYVRDEVPECDDQCITYMWAFIGISTSVQFLTLVIDCLMVHGVLHERPRFLTPYLVKMAMSVGFMFAFLVLGAIAMFSPPPTSSIGHHMFAFGFFGVFVSAYIYSATKSHRLVLMQQQALAPTRLLEEDPKPIHLDLPPPYEKC